MKLNIANITIRQDAEGRYSLADLHQASGANPNHRPSKWLRSQRTQNLIAVLESKAQNWALLVDSQTPDMVFEKSPVSSVRGGEYESRGTFVAWQLVYNYAMWVSPQFEIKVIETFHTLQNRPRIQHEKAIETKHPFYPVLRAQVLEGKKDREIAPVIGRSPASAGYHRKKQFNEGYTDPVEATYNRYAPATARKVIVKRGYDQWGSNFDAPQFDLKFE